MIGEWKAFLQSRAANWGLPEEGEWRFVFNNNYHPHSTNLNLLWFHDGEQFPGVVAKFFREPAIPKHEFESLTKVYACAPNWVPKPLHFGLVGQFWVLWMKGVPGLRFRLANGSSSPAQLRSMVQMVAGIHERLRAAETGPAAGRYERMVLKPLQVVADFGSLSSVREGCAKVAALCSPEWFRSLPVIPQHGDLFVSNVLLHQDQWHIVDWETFGVIDLPFYDVLTLLLSLLRARGETPEQWDPSMVKQAPALVECYARELGFSSEEAALLLPLSLANWFHLQWLDGRERFTELMYKAIANYFEQRETWEKVFLPSASLRSV